MLVELAMLAFAATSTGGLAVPPSVSASIERTSDARPCALGDDASGPLLLAASGGSGGSGSRGSRSSKGSSSNRGAGGYQQSGEGGYRQTGEGGYAGGGGQGRKEMNIPPPNTPGAGIRTTPPISPQWSPQWSPPGS